MVAQLLLFVFLVLGKVSGQSTSTTYPSTHSFGPCTSSFTEFQGAYYSLIETNFDWFTSKAICESCGGYMMGWPTPDERDLFDHTLGADLPAWSSAWVDLRTDYWCSFYVINSSKQFSGTNCLSNLGYVLCKKDSE